MAHPSVGHGLIPGTSALNNFTSIAFDFSAGGDNIVISAIANQTIRVFRLFLVCSTATSLTFKNGAAINLTGALSMSANGGITLDLQGEAWFVATAGNAFIIYQSGAAQVGGKLDYQQS